jgi:hypothetical protein
MRHEHLGRYSFLACNPSQSLVVTDGVAFLDGERQDDPPFACLQRTLDAQPPAPMSRPAAVPGRLGRLHLL